MYHTILGNDFGMYFNTLEVDRILARFLLKIPVLVM